MTAALDMFPETRVDPDELPDDRYTTRETLDWCLKKVGVEEFDLDVAACAESHKAPMWMDTAVNGLTRAWFGRVWCNPPYSEIEKWVTEAWLEFDAGHVDVIAMLVPATRTEQPWWQELVEPYRDDNYPAQDLVTHFLPGRPRFGAPGNPDAVGVGSPKFGCVLLVWRRP